MNPGSPPPEHGNCPACGASFDGEGIWQYFYDRFTSPTGGDWQDADGNYSRASVVLTPEQAERRADEVAENYGATRTRGRFGRKIGIYSRERDRTVEWMCPDCEHTWPR